MSLAWCVSSSGYKSKSGVLVLRLIPNSQPPANLPFLQQLPGFLVLEAVALTVVWGSGIVIVVGVTLTLIDKRRKKILPEGMLSSL